MVERHLDKVKVRSSILFLGTMKIFLPNLLTDQNYDRIIQLIDSQNKRIIVH